MRTRFEIYCDILCWGLLNIRNHADNAQRCMEEADHLNNLPELLRNLDNEELHRFYWNVTRECFINRSKPEWLGHFRKLWGELEQATLRETGIVNGPSSITPTTSHASSPQSIPITEPDAPCTNAVGRKSDNQN